MNVRPTSCLAGIQNEGFIRMLRNDPMNRIAPLREGSFHHEPILL